MPRHQKSLNKDTAAARQRLIEQLQEQSQGSALSEMLEVAERRGTSDGDQALRAISFSPPVRVAEAPPAVVLSESGTRFLCGYCGTLLVIAAPEQMTRAVVLCRNCGRHNELGS